MKENKLNEVKQISFLLIILLTASLSCKKEGTRVGDFRCFVKQEIITDAGGNKKTASYIYKGVFADKLEFSDNTKYVMEYDHMNGAVSTRRFYTGNSLKVEKVEDYTHEFFELKRKEIWVFDAAGNSTLSIRNNFNHTEDRKLSGVRSFNNGKKDFEYIYTGNNITKVKVISYDVNNNITGTQTYHYTYDTNKNYLRRVDPNIFFIDPIFLTDELLLFPLVYSENNVVSIDNDVSAYPNEYKLNSLLRLGEVKIGLLNVRAKYIYDCK